KRGDELLSLRAQKDYSLLALNDEYKHIQNNSKTIIDNDKEETIANDSTLTVGNNLNENIKFNHISTVEKEKVSTVQEDYELHVLKDFNTIVKKDFKQILEKNYIQRVKGTSTEYIEKDVKKKYLQNMFLQIGREYRLDINKAYHMKAKTIKQTADTIELVATKGISLKCGGNVLTLDKAGIHLKAPIVDATSSNGGVSAKIVTKPEILKPLYNKLRVVSLTATILKQNSIEEVLTFTASVEKYENDVWIATTELTATQEIQLQWYFIKNNDESDKDILTDNPTDDNVTVNGLEMSVTLNEENRFKYGHAHCYVVDAEKEGYAVSELKRYLEVEDIRYIYPKEEEGGCTAILNIDEPRAEELAQIRWTVEGREEAKYNGKDNIIHNLKEEKVYEINFTAYIDGKPEDAANATLVYDERNNEEIKENLEKEEI
ncbi:MAG: type VI secretion system tip protein VgrG, partial [Halarcobacter sp.]